jgi:hypothetical protein
MWRIEGAKLPSVVAGKLCHATLATGYLRMIKLTQYTFKHFFIDKLFPCPGLFTNDANICCENTFFNLFAQATGYIFD